MDMMIVAMVRMKKAVHQVVDKRRFEPNAANLPLRRVLQEVDCELQVAQPPFRTPGHGKWTFEISLPSRMATLQPRLSLTRSGS